MIELNQIRLRQADRILFDVDQLRIADGWHLGVTGRNGCGKSTLFRLLLGTLEADQGELSINQGTRLACMAQEVPALTISALDYVLQGDDRLMAAQRQLDAAEHSQDGHAIGNAHALLDSLDAWSAPARASSLLAGLSFSEAQQQQQVADFSGGWRMRLNLARTLMARADVLLLDEPTNHLDLEAVLWLGDTLKAYPGTLLLVSHDKAFLDSCVDHILHIEQQHLSHYVGDYSSFERQRAEQLSQQQKAFEKQQRQREHLQSFIDRFQAKASKAKQAQSRIKALARLQVSSPAHVDSSFSFNIEAPARLPTPLLSLEEASCGYAVPLLPHINLTLTPDSRIGLLGANGAGKSTLIKTLAGTLPLLGGKRLPANDLAIGYFHQQQVDQLDMQASPFQLMQRDHPAMSELQVRKQLGSFGFHGDRVFEQIHGFSGGEKTRLALALLVQKKPALLLLDEPTNHLDIGMREALAMALQGYAGALVVISHDRMLLDTCVDDFLLVMQGRVSHFDGDLNAYAKLLRDHAKQTSNNSKQPDKAATPSAPVDARARRQQAAQKRAQLRPLKKRIEKLEKQLDTCQTQLQSIEQELADEALYQAERKAELQAWLDKQTRLTQQSNSLEDDLLQAMEELETMS